jgi:hypothetical protein
MNKKKVPAYDKKTKNKIVIKKTEIKKSHLKRNVLLLFLFSVAVLMIFVYIYAQKPAQGTVKVSSQNQKTENMVQDVPEVFMGKYFSFLYENTYAMKSHDISADNNDVILEQAYLSQSSAVSKKIVLTVRNLPTHNLDDCPDFKMRAMNPKKYRKEEFSLGNIKGFSFEELEQGNFEKTFLFLHEDFLGMMTILAPSSSDSKLKLEADNIVGSISWLK